MKQSSLVLGSPIGQTQQETRRLCVWGGVHIDTVHAVSFVGGEGLSGWWWWGRSEGLARGIWQSHLDWTLCSWHWLLAMTSTMSTCFVWKFVQNESGQTCFPYFQWGPWAQIPLWTQWPWQATQAHMWATELSWLLWSKPELKAKQPPWPLPQGPHPRLGPWCSMVRRGEVGQGGESP